MARHNSKALVAVNWSHGRPRTELGDTPPLPEAVEAVPFQDPETGRITDGKRAAARSAAKRRLLKELKANEGGIATLDPSRCAPWLSPFVRDGATYAMQLQDRFPDPALARLVGATCDAHVMSRALLGLAASGDKDALKESRQWIAEHRACMRELAALAGMTVKARGPSAPTPEELAAAAKPRRTA